MTKLGYHAFKKPRKLKNGKKVYRWYYYYIDSSGKQIQKSCGTSVKNREDAENFIRNLPPVSRETTFIAYTNTGSIYTKPVRKIVNNNILVREIAKEMYIPGSLHLMRRQQLKKSVSTEAILAGRTYIKHITTVWGEQMLRSLEMEDIMNYLFSLKRSGSWKNHYISVLNEIYLESQFMGCKIFKPNFPSIGRNYRKADVFTDAELVQFFKPENFTYDFFLFFLCMLSGGLRLGENMGLKSRQFIFEKKPLLLTGL
jgi:hypothetical protein